MDLFSIAFYNTENFFDVYDDHTKFDEDFLPEGKRNWTVERYDDKKRKIARVIGELGRKETGHPPLLVGLAEVEGKRVLNDLVFSEQLKKYAYDYVHFESKDERGIDVALLYRKEFVQILDAKPIESVFERENGRLDFSRDLLYVKFKIADFEIHSFTLHLPSRRDDDANLLFRNQNLQQLRQEIDKLLAQDAQAYILCLGDFNGNPNDEYAVSLLNTGLELGDDAHRLFNPMLNIGHGIGSLKHLGRWKLFDQFLFSRKFVQESKSALHFESAHIYRDEKLKDKNRRFKGAPFRTFAGSKYLGGYSDHFPIYAILRIKQKE